MSTAKYYRFGHKFLLALQPLSHLLFWITGIFLLAILFTWWYVVAGTIFVRWILLRVINSKALEKLDERDLKPLIEIFDFIQLFYYFRFAKAAIFKSKYRWD